MKLPLPTRTAVLLLFACLAPALTAAEATPDPAPDTIILPKFEVRGNAICSYGIGIVAVWDKKAERIGHIYIDEIASGSLAESIGLKRGDEILSLNGIKVTDMKGGSKRGSDLFELLVNQPVGRKIDVEVAVRVVKQVVLIANP